MGNYDVLIQLRNDHINVDIGSPTVRSDSVASITISNLDDMKAFVNTVKTLITDILNANS